MYGTWWCIDLVIKIIEALKIWITQAIQQVDKGFREKWKLLWYLPCYKRSIHTALATKNVRSYLSFGMFHKAPSIKLVLHF
jgi:hypothetical protein